MLQELQSTLSEKGITFSWDEAVLDFLVKDSFSVTYGARNLRRSIQKHLEDPIATRIIESYLNPIKTIKAVVEDEKVSILSL